MTEWPSLDRSREVVAGEYFARYATRFHRVGLEGSKFQNLREAIFGLDGAFALLAGTARSAKQQRKDYGQASYVLIKRELGSEFVWLVARNSESDNLALFSQQQIEGQEPESILGPRPPRKSVAELEALWPEAIELVTVRDEADYPLPDGPSADAFSSGSRRRPEPLDQSDEARSVPKHSDALKDSTEEHQRLVIEFWDQLELEGREPRQGTRGKVEFDLGWVNVETGDRWIGEVKSISSKNEADQMRKAIGQLLDYQYSLNGVRLAILLRERSKKNNKKWAEICSAVEIEIFTLEDDNSSEPSNQMRTE